MSEIEFPKDGSKQSGSSRCYSVEARSGLQPQVVNGTIYASEWKRVSFEKVPAGFGVPSIFIGSAAKDFGLLTYQAAQALRWWFHAEASHSYTLETRLVEHMVEYSSSEKRVRAIDPAGCEANPSFGPPKNPRTPGGGE